MKLLSSILNSSNHNALITLDIVVPFFLPFPFFFKAFLLLFDFLNQRILEGLIFL